jgi:helix-turn-helix protein
MTTQAKQPAKLSQAEQILNYLKSGHTLTTLDALAFFNCFRLASRISELRSEGHPIISDMITTSSSKKKVARYRLSNIQAQTSLEMAAPEALQSIN